MLAPTLGPVIIQLVICTSIVSTQDVIFPFPSPFRQVPFPLPRPKGEPTRGDEIPFYTLPIPQPTHLPVPRPKGEPIPRPTREPVPTPTPTPYVDLDKAMLVAYDCATGNPLPNDGPDKSFKAAYNDNRDRRHTRPGQPKKEENKRSIIGDDERLRVVVGSESRFPYCSIGAIRFGPRGCTGFFVSPKHALTAAHCIFHARRRNWLGAPHIHREQNCINAGILHECTRVYVPKGWTDPGPFVKRLHYDYALILFERASPCHMSFGFVNPWPKLGLSTVGYPLGRTEAEICMCARRRRRAMCYGYSGNSVAENDWFLDHQSDTLPGNSGGPLYASDLNIQPPSLQVVYAIHTQGLDRRRGRPDRNRGVRITKHLWHQFVQRIKKDGQNVTVVE